MYTSACLPTITHIPTPIPRKKNDTSNFMNAPRQTLRQRLLMDEEDAERSPGTASQGPPVDTNKAFFDRLTARVNALGRPQTPEQVPAKDPATSSRAPANALVLEIKEIYSRIGAGLHKETSLKLAEAQKTMENKLAQINRDDGALLATVMKQDNQFSRPLFDANIEVKTVAAGQARTEVLNVGEVATRFRSRVTGLESELQLLWAEVEQAQDEVEGVAREVMGGTPVASPESLEGTLALFRELIENELVVAAQEATDEMEESEAEFKRLIMEEQNIFFMNLMAQPSQYD